MPGMTHHERLFRGDEVMDRLPGLRITICGAGALGSNLSETLVRQGCGQLRVIDHDRVEEHNIGTQTYGLCDVGAWKVDVLRTHLFRIAEVDTDVRRLELSERTIRKGLRDSEIVVDAFDNSASRQLLKTHCAEHGIPCLHMGLSAGYGEVVWNDGYRVPEDADDDVCDYPLARNIVMLTVSVAADLLIRWVISGEETNMSITLNDFAIRPLETVRPED